MENNDILYDLQDGLLDIFAEEGSHIFVKCNCLSEYCISIEYLVENKNKENILCDCGLSLYFDKDFLDYKFKKRRI